MDVSTSLAGVQFERGRGREQRDELVLAPKDYCMGNEIRKLGFCVDTESMTISLPQKKVDDLVEWLSEWPTERKITTVKEVLVLATKLHHADYATM